MILKRFRSGIFRRNAERNAYEAVILSQLRDSRIPELLGVINQQNFYGFVLEFKQGETVKSLLFRDKHRFSEYEIYDIGRQLISIITYLHEKGIVHRDIRIPNVLIHQGEVCLIDFGLARWADRDRYTYDVDFSYLGDFLLYLLYSSYEPQKKRSGQPWYDELRLTEEQRCFLKRVLGLNPGYECIKKVETDFIRAFSIEHF